MPESSLEKIKLSPEQVGTPLETEPSQEQIGEKSALEKPSEAVKPISPTKPLAPPRPAPVAADEGLSERIKEIDNILADGLHNIFLQLETKQQERFKAEGEKTVLKINQLLSETKVRVNKIVKLIKDWLKLIPGLINFS